MNSSQFMDKQIMGLSASGSQPVAGGGSVEFFDLMNSKDDRHQNGGKKEEILPSYDFQPIRTPASSPPPADAARRSWSSGDSKIGSSSVKYGGILEPCEVANITREKEKGAYDQATIAEIDRTVKKHADNLLHALEGVSSSLLHMESRTRHLENSMDELKVSIENNEGSTDGKLRHLENILREVQTSVQVLRDKQDIAEAQLQLAKLQTSKGDLQQSETSNTGQFDLKQHLPPPPSQPQPIQQAVQPPVVASPQVPPLPALPAPGAPPPLLHENPNSSQFPPQLSQSQLSSMPSLPRDSYFPPPGQTSDTTHQQYQMSPQQPQAPQPPPPTQHYQSSLQLPQYSQPPPQPPQSVNPLPQLQPTLPHQPEESAPYPSYSYPPSIHQPPTLTHPSSGPPPPQQFYGSNPNMFEPPASRPSTGQHSFSGGYGPQAGSNYSDPYPYSGSPSHYSSSKPSPFSSSGPALGGSSNYPRLPTAQILPQAPPTGTSAGGSSGNRVPIDDVVDKVATMGFSREQVRAAVRKLTESGQAVDLNAVLDKLMNDGELQPQRGWFGR